MHKQSNNTSPILQRHQKEGKEKQIMYTFGSHSEEMHQQYIKVTNTSKEKTKGFAKDMPNYLAAKEKSDLYLFFIYSIVGNGWATFPYSPIFPYASILLKRICVVQDYNIGYWLLSCYRSCFYGKVPIFL
ncbi:hypothetical protein ACJX0J_018970, partial [Zea mays]